MTPLIAGLALFLGIHSVRIFADDRRTAPIARMGPSAWKGIYSLIPLAGFVLSAYGYGMSRLSRRSASGCLRYGRATSPPC